MVYVFDPDGGDWLARDLPEGGLLPGAQRLTVKAFRGRSESETLWTDKRAIAAADVLLALIQPLNVRYAFRRPAEGGHAGQSAHYAGLAFDIGGRLTPGEQLAVARVALNSAGMDAVEPLFTTPGWVHVEKRLLPAAGAYGGYPRLRPGVRGVHVFVLQDALITKGYCAGGLTGCFSVATEADVRRFQRASSLPVTGEADGPTWQRLIGQK